LLAVDFFFLAQEFFSCSKKKSLDAGKKSCVKKKIELSQNQENCPWH